MIDARVVGKEADRALPRGVTLPVPSSDGQPERPSASFLLWVLAQGGWREMEV